jgi:flagellar motility protein MotE (MotC chaperone)
MTRIQAPTMLQLVTASGFAMFALLTMKSNEVVREFLAPSAHAEAVSNPAPSPAVVAASANAAPVSDEERQLLQDLRARKQDLDGQEKSLGAREAALSAAEKRLSDRAQELKDLQASLQSLVAASDQKSDASWQGLVSVYESMKPAAAATILNSLDMPVLLQIFDRMKDRKAALILSEMDPDRARLVTVDLAKLRSTRVTPSPLNS